MDIEKYREAVRRLILDYTQHKSSDEEIQSKAVIDDERGHYEVMQMGWRDKKRVYGLLMHFEIIDDKIWLQYNGTDRRLAEELVDAGVPRKSIVLGFLPPHVRSHTAYAPA